MRRRGLSLALGLLLGAGAGVTAGAQSLPATAGLTQNIASLAALPADPAALPAPLTRNGHQIFASFREGLAMAQCDADATSPRWRRQFAHAPSRLGNVEDDALPLFGYVVDELRAAGLPTEFALIPFVESGYRPGARNASGPAGLWQFIATTARNHRVPMESGYDGRLSAVDSTRAAVRYLKTLYGMFGGDWQLAVMAYNAGEYRILQALRRGGMNAQNARPAELPGLSPITHAYVEKLHALACVLEQAEKEPELMAALDRPVPVLRGHALPAGTSLADWSARNALDPARVARLNPAVTGKRAGTRVLAPALPDMVLGSESQIAASTTPAAALPAPARVDVASSAVAIAGATGTGRGHTVRSGESAWTIARRYGIPVKTLLSRNNLDANAILKPGMVLRFEESR
ncbi:MAG: lytic transglycosylase [Lysobacteraceae bacterium SCN 69-123]|mgnify:CR=1 FL=1|uniref:lytic transglycosylase domain-containing protein n=1 Tax=Stenotrophomonas acidaminiphila TaxID=128780 RepID=UPI00086AA08F|nr:lytic transglycosylase domain-containing protein [Stenotrophomonas acidaminiphila]MBN8800859.1 transglycosylase SLT domain-containing protein [Stenotrophomonas acidaminiphila]MDF9442820.1 LysM peptidoglycan-binding domain-containing protein [Stenotrophomonas acidaminiphila]ODU47639.1 MAG: lytic transglycosylase [Xanthomonadaceae bacterium SCN 69-123]OJY78147.1 MAG: lytic transglycosylase [Stenotrophomonas sp. 69-14]